LEVAATRTNCDPARLYWRDIKDAEPLSRQREVELFTRAHQGDQQARQELVTANLRFVVSVASDYSHHGMSLIELISAGNVGLMEAIQRFDETRGFKFITYAAWWIRQAIFKALGENGRAVRAPMSQINDMIKVEKETGLLSQSLGRAPSREELADKAGLSLTRILTAQEVGQQALSLDAPLYADEDTPLASVLPAQQEGAESKAERTELKRALDACLQVLDARELRILRAYYGLEDTEPQTMEEIGDTLGVTRERVRQLSQRALAKLLHHGGELLAEFCQN
jgi:RNA polymerase primary sigma factor